MCILKELDHDNVVKIHEFYTDDPKHDYIVLDLVRGGELLNVIINKVGDSSEIVREWRGMLLPGTFNLTHKTGLYRNEKSNHGMYGTSSIVRGITTTVNPLPL